MGEGRGAWRRFSAWFWGTEAARFALLPVTILFSVFSAVNILNYMDRGIVPGAFQTMGTFIQDDLHVNGTDSYIGGLQSSFIGGYSIASITFGHLVHTLPPFKLMSIGLFIWVIAVIISAVSPHFWVLVLARVLSGVGEASFQTVVPPFIDDNAPPAKRGLYLAIFYMAIPVGTAIGYAVGGALNTAGGIAWWRWCFFIEAMPMLPIIVFVWLLPYNKVRRAAMGEAAAELLMDEESVLSPTEAGVAHHKERAALVHAQPTHMHAPHVAHHYPPTDAEILSEADALLLERGQTDAAHDTAEGKPSFYQELCAALRNPTFMSVVFGYSGFTGVVAGIGTFAPTVILGMRLLEKQATASLAAGAVVSVGGLIGVPIGGWMIDYFTRRREMKEMGYVAGADEDATNPRTLDRKLQVTMPLSALMCLVGTLLLLAAVAATKQGLTAFLAILLLSVICLMGTTAGVNLAMMAAVPAESRSFAIGLGTLLNHAFGDVPAPPIIGDMADHLSPETCVTPNNCTRSAEGLRDTLYLTTAWLFWPIVLWTAAWYFASRRAQHRLATGYYETQGAPRALSGGDIGRAASGDKNLHTPLMGGTPKAPASNSDVNNPFY